MGMFTSLDGSLFIIPVCYHPTTLVAVDDDKAFLTVLSAEMADKLPLLCFNNPDEAIMYTKYQHHYLPFTDRCLIEQVGGLKLNVMAIRNEIYNPDRFKEIAMVSTDYDMPGTTGTELIRKMEFQPEVSQYSLIILTGKISKEFKEKIAEIGKSNEYIGKDDPGYVEKLLKLINKRVANIFQWYSYMPARILSKIKNENTSILFDGNFMAVINEHIKKNNICEMYLFDSQGSYVFLDDEANLSWLFVRNETGIENTIKQALSHGAPRSVIDELKSREKILSLYEKEDFEKNSTIDWDRYLLPVTVFESNMTYLDALPGLSGSADEQNSQHPKYYYAFTCRSLDLI